MNAVRTSIAAALLATGALAMTACNDSGGGGADSPKAGLAALNFANGTAKQNNAPANTGDFFRGPRTDPAATRWVELSVGSANGLSPIVHDGSGFTLYRFDKDSPKPPTSNCDGPCAETWPPVVVTAGSKIFFSGVPRSAIGVVRRHDGRLQVTLGGWPIYHYSKDTGPGQTNGENVGGTWFAVSPKGGKVLPPSGATGTGGGGTVSVPPSSPPAGGGVTLGNGTVILDSGKNLTEPNGSVGESGPGCKTLGSPFPALSLQLAGGPIKIWTGPGCTGTSKVITRSEEDLTALGFTQPIASIRFGG